LEGRHDATNVPTAKLLLLLLLQIRAERASIIAKHATALHELQRLPCFLRLMAQVILQVGTQALETALMCA
jgi:hypothetical protein